MSQDSTEEYGQTPFAEFSWQVHSLCKSVWPDTSEEVYIDYIKGGSSNRVFGLSFLKNKTLAIDNKPLLENGLAPVVHSSDKDGLPPNLDDSAVDCNLSLREESLVVPVDLALHGDLALEKISPPDSTTSSESSEGETNSPSSSFYSVDENESTFYLPPEPIGEHYVLRVPRFSSESIADYVATLEYINQHTTLPVPKLIHYDLIPDNPIGSPYSNQYRCPGMPLNLIYHQLTFRQQCDVSSGVWRVLCEMQKVQSSTPGQIGHVKTEAGEARKMDMDLLSLETNQYWNDRLTEKESCSNPNFKILHYGWNARLHEYDPYDGRISTLEGVDTLGILIFQLSRYMIAQLFRDNICIKQPYGLFSMEYPQLLAMAREMNELGCFGYDHTMALCHWDFDAHNLMATIENDQYGTVKIEAILDWDNAIFAPYFMSSLPPMWLWSNDDNSPDDEPSSYEDPTDEGDRMLKYRFNLSAGPNWRSYAYEPQWRLARRLFGLALGGFKCSSDQDNARALLAEWEEHRKVLLREEEDNKKVGEKEKGQGPGIVETKEQTEPEEGEEEDDEGMESEAGEDAEVVE